MGFSDYVGMTNAKMGYLMYPIFTTFTILTFEGEVFSVNLIINYLVHYGPNEPTI
jgi:hypothetical protein